MTILMRPLQGLTCYTCEKTKAYGHSVPCSLIQNQGRLVLPPKQVKHETSEKTWMHVPLCSLLDPKAQPAKSLLGVWIAGWVLWGKYWSDSIQTITFYQERGLCSHGFAFQTIAEGFPGICFPDRSGWWSPLACPPGFVGSHHCCPSIALPLCVSFLFPTV